MNILTQLLFFQTGVHWLKDVVTLTKFLSRSSSEKTPGTLSLDTFSTLIKIQILETFDILDIKYINKYFQLF